MPQTTIVPSQSTPTFLGRTNTFRTPGRAGTSGQKLLAFFNAPGSGVVATLNVISVKLYQTVVKAVTVAPPIVRVHRIDAAPTQGTVLTKVTRDSSLGNSNAGITIRGDASADGTGSNPTLNSTPAANAILAQEFASRLITAAGYEAMDRIRLFETSWLRFRPGEGFLVELAYTAATQNPVTDMWIATADWDEASW
jgi:hypothetical protein